MADGHTRRDSVRIYDHIWHNTFSSKGQVFLPVGHTASTLLTMTTSKLIANLWDPYSSHLNFGKSEILLVGSDDDLINDTTFCLL